MKKGKIYIVPTPIGNLEDITFRAVKVLKNVKCIGAEDTRTSAKLMKHYQIETPMFSYHKFNERSRVDKILSHLQNGEDVAIISDAGTPGISDPAEIIIKKVLENDFAVEVLPGATAFLPALVASGLNCKQFHFAGFLPEKESSRTELLESILELKSTLIFYEAPHRIIKTLKLLLQTFGNRSVVLARELTKIHESFYRASLQEFIDHPESIRQKGEFVIIMEGAGQREYSDEEICAFLLQELSQGKSRKKAVESISSQLDISKNRVYDLVLKL